MVASFTAPANANTDRPARNKMRILAVDPGEKHIGIALSDPTGTIATPLKVLLHISRPLDAVAIANLAQQHKVEMIIIGQSLDEDGSTTPQSRRATRLADAIHQQCDLPVTMWDESFSTHEARRAKSAIADILARLNKGEAVESSQIEDLLAYVREDAGRSR